MPIGRGDSDPRTEPDPTPLSSDPPSCLAAFRDCFNSGRFYEAHDVLENLWLPVRRTPEGELWQGLIQLAAAFVHVQHDRRGPARALFRSARAHLQAQYREHQLVDLPAAIAMSQLWEDRLGAVTDVAGTSLLEAEPPRLYPPPSRSS